MGAPDTAGRLAKHNAEMRRAIADGVSLVEARRRIAQDASRDANARLAARQCGSYISRRDRGELPEQWWQR
ncbi:hypothetical protein QH494_06090 [Sphingomonas sp. AR_OL41]|uniref:hypothetical protein n=1 Tax=Sphingomonas sp. AR_OL41 TaxID=3042729 RepID=UPI00247FE382|nr:hypothetical protein [Sphingomonas sp. AR_OL41]MDH7971748.1 hypothetical protein [Sphingomonas sp. AR_OL41]